MSDRTRLREARRAARRREREERQRAIEEREAFEGLQVDPDTEFYEEIAERKPGDSNIVRWGFDIHPQVTFDVSRLPDHLLRC